MKISGISKSTGEMVDHAEKLVTGYDSGRHSAIYAIAGLLGCIFGVLVEMSVDLRLMRHMYQVANDLQVDEETRE